MGKYVTDQEVKDLLVGKVSFTEDDNDKNKMQLRLLRTLIGHAESELELDLSARYTVPFLTIEGASFESLPDSTKSVLKLAAKIKCLMLVLDTDFGRSTVTDASKYYEGMQKRYDGIVANKLLRRRKIDGDEEGHNRWYYPPLTGLQLNYFNTEGDDGYAGMIFNTSISGDGGFPAKEINDPSENWWSGSLDE